MPIAARTITWPERARPKAAIAASNGISMIESGRADLVRQAGARLVGRSAGGLELGDARLQRPIIVLGRVDLGEGELVGRDALERLDRGRLADDVLVGVVDLDVPRAASRRRGRGGAPSALMTRWSTPPVRS